jgi:hypothetical protein
MSQSFFYLRCATGPWSRTTQRVVLAVILSLAGCSQGAKLVKADETGGTVIYPFGERGSLLAPFRQDALRLIADHCRGPYRVVREGETRSRSRINENPAGGEVIQERRWGIEFECKH